MNLSNDLRMRFYRVDFFLHIYFVTKGTVALAINACNICISLSSDWSEIFEIMFDQSEGRGMQLLHVIISSVTAP